MNNETEFFRELAKLEKLEYSPPLTDAEAEQIFWDVSNGRHPKPLMEFVRRIENAHGIGVKNARRSEACDVICVVLFGIFVVIVCFV
jgi:hypothetical protein